MVGRLGWYDSQYPVALSACLSGKGVRSEVTVRRSRRELSNAYFLAKFGFDTAENEPSKVWPLERPGSPGGPGARRRGPLELRRLAELLHAAA